MQQHHLGEVEFHQGLKWLIARLEAKENHHLPSWNAFCVLFFKATLPLKPATIALKIGHKRLSRMTFSSMLTIRGNFRDLKPLKKYLGSKRGIF